MARRNVTNATRLGTVLLLLLAIPALASPPSASSFPPWLAAEAPAKPGTCTQNDQCAKGELCAKLFGSCEESGKCSPRPEDCKERGKLIVKPVCGCDGKSYDNYCLASAAGVNVKSEGKCAP